MTNCTNWKKLHKIIDKDKKHDNTNKEADKMLVYEWGSFEKIKGKTMGDVIKKTEKEIGVHPSFLAVMNRHDKCGAEKYIKSKYLGVFK